MVLHSRTVGSVLQAWILYLSFKVIFSSTTSSKSSNKLFELCDEAQEDSIGLPSLLFAISTNQL